jgi:hypothetical protein
MDSYPAFPNNSCMDLGIKRQEQYVYTYDISAWTIYIYILGIIFYIYIADTIVNIQCK